MAETQIKGDQIADTQISTPKVVNEAITTNKLEQSVQKQLGVRTFTVNSLSGVTLNRFIRMRDDGTVEHATNASEPGSRVIRLAGATVSAGGLLTLTFTEGIHTIGKETTTEVIDEGDRLYLGTEGRVTINPPIATGTVIKQVGIAVAPSASGADNVECQIIIDSYAIVNA